MNKNNCLLGCCFSENQENLWIFFQYLIVEWSIFFFKCKKSRNLLWAGCMSKNDYIFIEWYLLIVQWVCAAAAVSGSAQRVCAGQSGRPAAARIISSSLDHSQSPSNKIETKRQILQSFNWGWNIFVGLSLICDIQHKKNTWLFKMGVNEEDVVNIMGGMEHAGGIKLNDHKRKLKNR